MFTTVLDAVDRAGGFVAETVSRPIRQVSGMLSSIKAIIESLRTPVETERVQADRPAGGKDRFL
jgi:hypothetical protein